MRRFLIIITFLCWVTNSALSQRFFEVESIEEAQIKVYYETEDANCDLKVCFVYEAKDITKIGLWMEVPTAAQADIKIIFVDDPAQADIHIMCRRLTCRCRLAQSQEGRADKVLKQVYNDWKRCISLLLRQDKWIIG